MLNWLYDLFGTVIKFIYENTGENFGVALIIFTVFMKVVLLPLSIKQQRSMMAMQKLQPQLTELQRKYANDKDKLSRETMDLYKKNNASPFGGCLPMILQMVILIVMINVVYRPATYVMGLENIAKGLPEQMQAAVDAGMHFDFLGINLAKQPMLTTFVTAEVLISWILPVLATLGTYFSGVASQKMSSNPAAANSQGDDAQQMTKSMTTVMPIMTLVFTFTLPLSASLYWFISSVTQVLQQYALSKILKVEVENEGGLSYHEKRNQKRKNR